MIENIKFKQSYNFAFIDESTKKEIRRSILKGIALPGHQIPYSSPEMPIARGWGTGGLHISLSIIGRDDTFKVIDQGSDASVNACNIRDFVNMTTGCTTTFETVEASIIQWLTHWSSKTLNSISRTFRNMPAKKQASTKHTSTSYTTTSKCANTLSTTAIFCTKSQVKYP